MQIRLAAAADRALVTEIVQKTIREQYPHYDPPGAVSLFLQAQTSSQIGEDVDKGLACLCWENDQAVAAITIDGSHLSRQETTPLGRALCRKRGCQETDHHLMWGRPSCLR